MICLLSRAVAINAILQYDIAFRIAKRNSVRYCVSSTDIDEHKRSGMQQPQQPRY